MKKKRNIRIKKEGKMISINFSPAPGAHPRQESRDQQSQYIYPIATDFALHSYTHRHRHRHAQTHMHTDTA